MSQRHPIAAVVMLTLLLLQVGAAPVMTDCASAHHERAAAAPTQGASHGSHGAETATTGNPTPVCDQHPGDGASHSATDCAQMMGCATGNAMLAPSSGLLTSVVVHGNERSVLTRVYPRSVRPNSPPPKS